MIIADQQTFLEILVAEVQDHEGYSDPDVKLTIKVKASGFEGVDDIWVLKADFLQFLAEVKTLGEKLQGTARLKTMSPEVFPLEIQVIESTSVILLRGELRKHSYGIEKSLWNLIQFDMYISDADLENIQKELQLKV